MQTIQDKIINQIATMVATRTTNDSFPVFETALQLNYSNKGKIFILHAGSWLHRPNRNHTIRLPGRYLYFGDQLARQ